MLASEPFTASAVGDKVGLAASAAPKSNSLLPLFAAKRQEENNGASFAASMQQPASLDTEAGIMANLNEFMSRPENKYLPHDVKLSDLNVEQQAKFAGGVVSGGAVVSAKVVYDTSLLLSSVVNPIKIGPFGLATQAASMLNHGMAAVREHGVVAVWDAAWDSRKEAFHRGLDNSQAALNSGNYFQAGYSSGEVLSEAAYDIAGVASLAYGGGVLAGKSAPMIFRAANSTTKFVSYKAANMRISATASPWAAPLGIVEDSKGLAVAGFGDETGLGMAGSKKPGFLTQFETFGQEGNSGRYAQGNRQLNTSQRHVFKSESDPLLRSIGDAKISHPEEYAAIMNDLRNHNVEVIFNENTIAFGPNPGGGIIGNQIHLPGQFSISALRHEYGHFLDHKSLGYPKLIDYMKNPNFRVRSERRQYLHEIRFAKDINDQVAREILTKNYLKERADIVDKFYQKKYGEHDRIFRPVNKGE